jgi:hypothetical protein
LFPSDSARSNAARCVSRATVADADAHTVACARCDGVLRVSMRRLRDGPRIRLPAPPRVGAAVARIAVDIARALDGVATRALGPRARAIGARACADG